MPVQRILPTPHGPPPSRVPTPSMADVPPSGLTLWRGNSTPTTRWIGGIVSSGIVTRTTSCTSDSRNCSGLDRDLRRDPALHRRRLPGVRLDPCRRHPGTRALRHEHALRQAEKGHLTATPAQGLEARPQQVETAGTYRRARTLTTTVRPEGAHGLAVDQVTRAVAALDTSKNTALNQHVTGVCRFRAGGDRHRAGKGI